MADFLGKKVSFYTADNMDGYFTYARTLTRTPITDHAHIDG